MNDPVILRASLENIQSHQDDPIVYRNYLRLHQIDQTTVRDFAGALVVRNIVDCGGNRFEFARPSDDQFPAIVCEAFGSDGETVIDLVAWPLDRPKHVMTMFGRCGLLGAWEAMNPATYYLDAPLLLHRTPLEWMQAGCRGAVVVVPHVAARMILDLPGKVAVRDADHGRQIEAIRQSVLPPNQVLVPVSRKGLVA